MRQRIISFLLVLAILSAVLPATTFYADATQTSPVVYEMREEIIEFKLSDGTLYYSNTISYPYFLGNSVVEIKINNKYASIIEECKNNSTDFDAVYQEVLAWNPNGVIGLPFYDDISAEVVYCNNGVISIKERLTMWSGGMHSYSYYNGYNYLISDGSELSLNDIFVGSEQEKHNLVNQYKQGVIDYCDAERIMAEPFVLTENGLCFICNVGDAVPREEIIIPFTNEDTYVITAEKMVGEMNAEEVLQYFIDKCDSRYFNEADIAGLDENACLYARNAIYAKSGWDFSDQKLKRFFQQYSWYIPSVSVSDFNEGMLNEYQIANRNLIVEYEKNISGNKHSDDGVEPLDISTFPYIGDISKLNMTAEQSKAYENIIRKITEKFEKDDAYAYADDRAVYATFIDLEGNTLLWLAGITIVDSEPEWPGDIAFGNGSMQIAFEEIWEWNGSEAVEFNIISDYGASANYYPEGFEVFTFYGGTDVDGEAWRSLFAVENGMICRNPEWCYAWAWVYSYKLEKLNIIGLDKQAIVEKMFTSMMDDNRWPTLPFDWSKIEISHEFSDTEYYAEVTGGHGFIEFCNSKSEQYGYWPESSSKPIQCAAYIAKQDHTWQKADAVADFLAKHMFAKKSDYKDYARKEWIEQHMDYVASDEYQSEIVSGYSKRMMAVFRDALDDEDINSYETRKVVSSILNLELEFSETDMYELILAEILYGESGQSVTEEAYAQNLEKAVANITKVLANIATTGDSAKDIPEDTLRSIRELYELLQTLELGSEEYSTTYGKFISLIKGNVADIKSKIKTELVGDAAFAGLGIVIEGAFEQYDALEDILNYLNNYVAYQSTSQQTRDVLEKLLVVIYKNSDVNGLLSGDQILNELGLGGSMINWGDFRMATGSVMEAMVKYEQEGAAAVAAYAVDREREAASKFGQKAIKSVAVFAIEKAASCVPVINAILVAKNIVSAAVSASVILDQIFTNVTEREYAQDILTKSYIISVMLDQTVDDCASCMEEDDFYSSTVFDRSVIIYKQNLLNASGYAVKYADMVLKDAQQELFEYDQEWHLFDGRERLVKAVDWYTNSLAMLKEQQVDIESIACHDSDLYYDPLTDEIIYNFKDSRIYIVACPVSVVVKNEVGEQIAYLSGESDQVAEGYEFYFHTIKATADSEEYIKVAIVPDHYQIELIGTDDGTMNAFVADFTADDVDQVETYFNVPIKKDSVGYFEAATDGSDSTALVMDEAVYLNMESSEDIPTKANGNIQWIWIVGGVSVVVIGLFLLLKKKHRNA